MAHRCRHLIFGFIFALAFGRAVMGEPVAPPTVAAKEVSLSFNVFALGGAEGLAYLPRRDLPAQALRFYSAYRSSVYQYRGSPVLCFYDQAAADAGQPVATYTIPEGAGSLLLLFFPKETPSPDGIRYDVFGVDDSELKTPAGSFSTINISGREYAAQYGGTRITIPPGVGQAYPAKGHVVLRLAAQSEGRWLPAGKHDFNMSARDRVTLIFYPPANRTGWYPLIRRLVDGPRGPEDDKVADLSPSL